MKNGIWYYQEVKCTLKSEKYTIVPNLFHGPLDNEALTACLKASLAPSVLNNAEAEGL
jgi:hypothetical protein